MVEQIFSNMVKLNTEILKEDFWVDDFDSSNSDNVLEYQEKVYFFFDIMDKIAEIKKITSVDYNFSNIIEEILNKEQIFKKYFYYFANKQIEGKIFEHLGFLKIIDLLSKGSLYSFTQNKDTAINDNNQLSKIGKGKIMLLLIQQYIKEFSQGKKSKKTQFCFVNEYNSKKLQLWKKKDEEYGMSEYNTILKDIKKIDFEFISHLHVYQYDKIMTDFLYDIMKNEKFKRAIQQYRMVKKNSEKIKAVHLIPYQSNYLLEQSEGNLSLEELIDFFNDFDKNLNIQEDESILADVKELKKSLSKLYTNIMPDLYDNLGKKNMLLPCLLNLYEKNDADFLLNKIDGMFTQVKDKKSTVTSEYKDQISKEIMQFKDRNQFKLFGLYNILSNKETYDLIKKKWDSTNTLLLRDIIKKIREDKKNGKFIQNNFLKLLGIENENLPAIFSDVSKETKIKLENMQNEVDDAMQTANDSYDIINAYHDDGRKNNDYNPNLNKDNENKYKEEQMRMYQENEERTRKKKEIEEMEMKKANEMKEKESKQINNEHNQKIIKRAMAIAGFLILIGGGILHNFLKKNKNNPILPQDLQKHLNATDMQTGAAAA